MSAPSVVIASPAAVLAAEGRSRSGWRWVYLGKNVRLRQAVGRVRGPRMGVAGRMRAAVEELRQPFHDAVASIGIAERGRLAWWGTTFSWKVWSASDLFLLVAYLRVGEQLIADAVERGVPLLIVVEDPWLLAQFSRASHHRSVRVISTGLWRHKLKCAVLGVARRLSWLGVTLRARSRQRRASSVFPPPTAGDVAIYSMPLERCLQPNGAWRDPFLADLDAWLRDEGFSVRRFSPPESVGFEPALAERHTYFHPLIARVTAGAILRAFAAWWAPRRPWPDVAGLDITLLADREWWTDVARANWCRYRLFLEAARAFFATQQWRYVVYPFENHPWEKMLVTAANAAGVRTVGVQHSTLSVNYLSYFLGRAESDVMPIADAILASGDYAYGTLVAGGYPEGRVVLTGSMRYQHLGRPSDRVVGPARDVLVALPIDRPMAEHLLAAIGAAFPDGGAADGLRFHVREHPSTPVDPDSLGLRADRATGDLDELFQRCGSVIFVGTTLGPEAAARGLRGLRFRPELLVDVDVSEAVGEALPSCSDDDLRAAVLKLVTSPAPVLDRDALLKVLFAPVDADSLKGVFGAASARHS